MSTPALKPRPSAASTTHRIAGVAAGRAHGVGQVVPALHGKGVDRREVDRDDGDALLGA